MDKKKVTELIKKGMQYQSKSSHVSSYKEKAKNCFEEAFDELQKPEWISVEDELPPYEEEVWVTCKENTNAVWNSYRQKKLCKDAPLNAQLDHNGFTILRSNYPITHWRKIDKLEV